MKDILLVGIISGIAVGFTYNMDIPQALQIHLRNQPFDFSTLEFNLIYFFTFLPIVLFNIPIAILMHQFNLRKSMLILLLISLFSQIGLAFMFQYRPSGFIGLIFGLRVLYGVAGQGIVTGQALLLQQIAKENFETILGLCLTLPFIFNSLDSVITTSIYNFTSNLPLTWFVGCFFGLFSLFCLIIILICYKPIEKAKQQENSLNTKNTNQQGDNTNKQENNKNQQEDNTNKQEDNTNKFQIKDFKSLGAHFWILIGAIFCTEASCTPFLDNLNQLIVRRFALPYLTVGIILLIPYSFLFVFSIIISKILKKAAYWRRSLFVMSTLIYFTWITGLYILPNSKQPHFAYYILLIMFLFSMSFTMTVSYSALLTSINSSVEKRYLGTAWGIVGCAISISQCFMPLVNASIIDTDTNLSQSYVNLTLFGLCFSTLPIVFALYIYNSPKFNHLDRSIIS